MSEHIELDLEKYRGEWVALEPKTRRVLGHGPTLAVAERQAVERGVKRPLLMPVMQSEGFFIGLA